MIRIKTYKDIIDAVYGERWQSFNRPMQDEIMRLFYYWVKNGEIILSDYSQRDLEIAIDDALIEYCGIGYADALGGPRTRERCDLRWIIYKIVEKKTGMGASELHRFFRYTRDRATIRHALVNFDDIYKYDQNFRRKYDAILALTDKKLKTCEQEQSA